MKVARMKAERRSALGRNQTKKLRTEGWMPAVVYGGEGKESLSIQISEWELEQHVNAHHKVYELEIDGQTESTFLQAIQFKATTDRPVHADFLRVDLSKPIESDLEVTLLGHPAGLSKGGVLIKDHLIVRVRAIATVLPEFFEVNIEKLGVGDALLAKDLGLPEGVELVTDPEMTVCHVSGDAQTAGEEVAEAVEALESESGGAASSVESEADGKDEDKDGGDD